MVTGLPRPDRWTEVRPGTVELLVETAARHGHVVVDTGFSLEQDDVGGRPGRNQLTLAALEVADEVLVVGTADPVGLSRLARALVDLRETHPDDGRPGWWSTGCARPSAGPSATSRQMVAGFARPVGLHFLPEDRATVDRALVTGRTLLETDADAARSAVAVGAAGRRGRPGGRRRHRCAGGGRSGGEQQVEPTRGEAIIATSSESWPVSWCFRGSRWMARSWAAITPTTWPSTTASTLTVASAVGW